MTWLKSSVWLMTAMVRPGRGAPHRPAAGGLAGLRRRRGLPLAAPGPALAGQAHTLVGGRPRQAILDLAAVQAASLPPSSPTAAASGAADTAAAGDARGR